MGMVARMREDVESVLRRDPAAQSGLQVMLTTPGLHAVWVHRLNHALWQRGWRLTARVLSQWARFWTGVEIHPGARIGRRLLIDHGMGVVIGETAIVGDDVTLYQGVTLGGTGSASETAKRHPTLCNGVFVGNNANILGNICVGENSRVGAGSVVLRDVPPNSTVVGVPAHIVYRNGQRVLITDPHEIKDPLSDALIALAARVERLEAATGCAEATEASQGAGAFAAEDEEREAYRQEREAVEQELERAREWVSMGEGI